MHVRSEDKEDEQKERCQLLLFQHLFFQPRSQASLLPVPTERERDPGWVWSRGPTTKLIPREESFVTQFFCLVRFHRSRNDRKGKTDLLSLQRNYN